MRTVILLIFLAVGPSLADLALRAGTLASVAPAGASAGIAIYITGTGFNTTAGNNEVTFTHTSGSSATATGTLIQTVNAAQGLRRLRVTVPAGLPVGTAALRVRNLVTGELSAGRNLEILTLALPDLSAAPRGASQLPVRITGSSNSQFAAGSSRAAFGTGITVHATTVESATSLVATISVEATAPLGPVGVSVISASQTATLPGAFTIVDPNRPPAISSLPVTNATVGETYTYQVGGSDPDGDTLSFSLTTNVAGMSISGSGSIGWTPVASQVGGQSVEVEASDGRGGTALQAFAVVVSPAPTLDSIEVTPASVRFTTAGSTRQLEVTGHRSNDTTVALTTAASGATYENSNPFVASVSPDGLVTGLANGATTITARHQQLSDTASVDVEIGVTLESLELTPAFSTLRAAGAEQALRLTGRFSDGTTRDLTAHHATTYASSEPLVAEVTSDGRVSARTNGETTITARHDTLSATASVRVVISAGVGFLRGEVYDDTQGLPLAGASVSLLSDGGGPLAPPVTTVADDRGRFTLVGRAGEAVVRIDRSGFTFVERRGSMPVGSAATLVDARLTPIAAPAAATGSAFGGMVRDGTGRFTLQIPPGGLASDLAIALTPISPQGLAGRLPFGWSPAVAASIGPADVVFGVPAALTLPNIADLSPGTELTLARYSPALHEWVVESPIAVSGSGLSLTAPVSATGQFAVLVPDTTPAAPPAAVAGQTVGGVEAATTTPAGATAAGDVVPRSAAPGDDVRATGRVGLTAPDDVSSGVVLQVSVNERFDLLDQSQVVTPPFTQDIVLYRRPLPPTGGTLGATFPITPSRMFTIQQLMLGVITLDVTPFVPDTGITVVGAAGGSVTNATGDTLELPPGALSQDAAVELRRIPADQISPALADFDVLAALRIEAVGAAFAQPATISTPAPADISGDTQIFVGQAYADPFAVRRLRLVAIARLVGGRLVSDRAISGLTLPGVTGEGDYSFLRSRRPYGLTSGIVTGPVGGSPRLGTLVTSTAGPFSDLSALDGRFIVANPATVTDSIHALDPPTRATSAGESAPPARDAVVTLDLALAHAGLTVVSINPATGATNVALDTSITIDFASAVDPSSVSEVSAALQAAGTSIAIQRTLSADRRRLTLRPSSPLQGRTSFTVILTTAIRDAAGNALAGYTPASFTTLDPTRPPQPAAGQLIVELPDEDGFVQVIGNAGVSVGAGTVVVTNLRTQETAAVLALADGSFRLFIAARVGDELSLILRDPDGRETTIAITQFGRPGEATGMGARGGTFTGPGGHVGSILPRALDQPGVFGFAPASTDPLAALPVGLTYADRFGVTVDSAAFASLGSVSLSESQSRFLPQTALDAPFESVGSLTTPADALISTALRFTATAVDATGTRRSISAVTTIVATNPDTARVESSQQADFPSLFLDVPSQSTPNQQVTAHAIAPTARIDLERPAPLAGVQAGDTLLLVRATEVVGEARLAIVDRLTHVAGTPPRLRTAGRELPGITGPGEYAIVASRDPIVFVSGLASGQVTSVVADGLPFVFTTDGPNGRFIVPVRAGQTFSLRLYGLDGTLRGTAFGLAPVSGAIDVGSVLATSAGALTVNAEPDSGTIVDLTTPIVLRFSEPIDARGLTSAPIVTDEAGSRVFGTTILDSNGLVATFRPSRRWRFGTTYRYAVATTVQALSGARLSGPFTSEFTTFGPAVVGTLALGDTRDVAVAAGLAVAATATGLATVNVASPLTPALQSHVPLDGGAAGIALLPQTSIVDRAGTAHPGTFAVVASGSQSGTGLLQTFDVSAPASPAALGSTQVAAAAGTTPPAPVPPFSGTPRSVSVDATNRAFAAIENVGVASVELGQAVPPDPVNPGSGLGPRYPAASESASQVIRLGNRLLVAGAAGLTVLDASTLARLGGVSTEGSARGVAALATFPMDLNGDGIVVAAERFDLAAVANGADGTLQLFRVPATGDPSLISVVRFAGEATSVALDATERLAYVGLGPQGLAIVDLDGPSNIQPIDVDRNGVDDRVLDMIDTPGSTGRTALDLGRGLGFIADGAAGLTIVQLLPPRTAFQTLLRDPLKDRPGDEEDILQSRQAFTTDEAIRLNVIAAAGVESLALVIEETPEGGGARLLALEDGGTSTTLVSGSNEVVIDIAGIEGATGTRAVLKIQTTTSARVASLDLVVRPPDTSAATLQTLLVSPTDAFIPANRRTLQLSVGGFFSDGRVLNLTAAARGTRYESLDPAVATVDADGRVTAVAGGTAPILITSGGASASIEVRVEHPPALVTLEPVRRHLTLTAPGQGERLQVRALFSDRTAINVTDSRRSIFTSSDPSIVEIAADGTLIARSEGVATITITNGALQEHVQVAVEFRLPAALTGLEIAPFDTITTDIGEVRARATVTGTGSLDDMSITFSVTGMPHAVITARTTGEGVAIARFRGVTTPVTLTISASVVNPADGSTLTTTRSVTVTAGTGDHEPNNETNSASGLGFGRAVNGRLDAAEDRDVYRVEATTDGAIAASLTLTQTTVPTGLTIVFLSAAGAELQRVPAGAGTTAAVQQVPAGVTFVRVEAGEGPVTYTLSTAHSQAPVVVQSVVPASGTPGMTVTIAGTGFSIDLRQNLVFFGRVAASVTSATSTEIQALVPANAVDDTLKVVVKGRQATGPMFVTGNAAAPPPIVMRPPVQRHVRFDPASGANIDLQRLIVHFDPGASRSDVDSIVTSMGGTIAGVLPNFNGYILEFPSVATIRGLNAIRQELIANPIVVGAAHNVARDPRQGPLRFDTRDTPTTFANSQVQVGVAYAQARIFEAITAIRRSPAYSQQLLPGQLGAFNRVNVAVIDTGFGPSPAMLAREFTDASGNPIVRFFDATATPATPGSQLPGRAYGDPSPISHGTMVVSVIAALNGGSGSGSSLNGALNGLFFPGETPFQVLAYGAADSTGELYDEAILAALTDIANRGDVHVVNMSFGKTYPSLGLADADNNKYRPYFSQLGSTLVVTAAGEDGIEEAYSSPTSIAAEAGFEHVMSIGATAVTQGAADMRALLGGSAAIDGRYEGAPCDPADTLTFLPSSTQGLSSASNCGDAVTMAAPGQDVWVIRGDRYAREKGTSLAAPLVVSVAGLLRAISPGLTPAQLRDLLVDTGDDITGLWEPGLMRRLNALKAVRRLLPAAQRQRIYVADEPANRIIALEVDPMTGALQAPAIPDLEIPLTFVKDGISFRGEAPRSLAMSPAGQDLYAVVEAAEPAGYGDGILVINTMTEAAMDFLPLSGVPFPAPANMSITGEYAPRNRIPMVVSRDGRLLYVGVGSELKVMNLQDGKPVRSYFDLPAQYFVRAFTRPANELSERLVAIAVRLTLASFNGHGVISDMALSHDGKTLYAAYKVGGGSGLQPGGALAINVDLYTDASPNEFGLQSDLTRYLTINGPTFGMSDFGPAGRGDEPSAIAVGPGDRHVYLFNGGLDAFSGVTAEGLGTVDYGRLARDLFLLSPAAGPLGSLAGVMIAANAMNEGNNSVYARLLRDLRQQGQDGIVILAAQGVTAAFDTEFDNEHVWSFPANVATGWNGSLDTPIVQNSDFGLLIDQFNRSEVYAKLPAAVAMKPRGRDYPGNERALVAFGYTGNFGVLDLSAQVRFRNVPDPDPIFASLDPNMFHAFVAVTPAIAIGPQATPDRGAIRSPAPGDFIPSPDEVFQHTSDIEYAQNGRFAVAAHAGTHTPNNRMLVIPEFVNNLDARRRLIERGFTYSGGDTVQRNGASARAGNQVGLRVGGAAISIISDRAISADFDANLGDPVPDSDGFDRPYHSTIPICDEVDANGATPVPHCLTEAVTRASAYSPANGALNSGEFQKLRGVAIQPFAMIETPRTGDHVTRHTAIHVSWRDEQVNKFETSIFDLDAGSDLGGVFVHGTAGTLTPEQQETRSMTADFLGLFPPTVFNPNNPNPPAAHPFHNRRYRVEVHLLSGEEVLSTTFIDVRHENFIGPTPLTRIDLSPTILPFMLTPGGGQLSVTMRPNGAPAEDVTNQAQYAWMNGSANGGLNLQMDPSPVINRIRGHLQANSADPSVPVVFDIVPATVTPTGAVTLVDAGIQIIAARFDGIDSRPTVVLGGFNVDSISLETIGAESAFEADSLGAQVVAGLGKDRNAPLVIGPTDSTFVDDDGQVELADVVLRYVGGGSIRLNDLMDALRDLPAVSGNSFNQDFVDVTLGNLAPIGATPTWRNAQALVELMEGPGAPSLNYELDFETSAVSTAFVQTINFFGGRIRSNASGLAVITGTLDLGRLGSAGDGVLVWSLPQLESATIEPPVVVMQLTDPPIPGPAIITAVTTGQSTASIARPARFPDDLDFVQKMLPRDFDRLGTVFEVDLTVGANPQFGITGGGFFHSGTVHFNDFRLTFDVLNENGPGVTNQYTVADPTLVVLGETGRFTQHLVHQNRAGRTTLSNVITVEGLGSATAQGEVVVCDCELPAPGGPILLELALAPQQDWNDSAGGNGLAFDAVPGNGTIDGNDVWIEVSGGTTGTEDWIVELRDATGATFARPLGPPVVTSQTRILSGFGVGAQPTVGVRLIDQNGLVRQELDIAAIEAVLGAATDPTNETLTWSIHGTPSLLLQNFLRRPASINRYLPF